MKRFVLEVADKANLYRDDKTGIAWIEAVSYTHLTLPTMAVV